jgi:hypothetical protein
MVLKFDFKRGFYKGWINVFNRPSGLDAELHSLNSDKIKVIKLSLDSEEEQDIRFLLFNESVNRTYAFGYNPEEYPEEWPADDPAESEAWEYLEKILKEEFKTPVVRRHYWEK